jgi:serine/threonine-protein kinase RsbW
MPSDHITLTVPARSEYAKTVRLAAAALAGRVNMSYDDVEDVRMAAEEAFVYAVDTLPEGADVRFDFTVGDGAIAIDVPLGAEKTDIGDEDERAAGYAVFILESVCDEYEFLTGEDGAHLRLLKRAGSGDAE